jgi:SAM-dependent methyltransferase
VNVGEISPRTWADYKATTDLHARNSGPLPSCGVEMEPAEYEVMYQREENYWWYVGLRDLVLSHIARFSQGRESLTILDAGCGTGKLLEMCQAYRAYGLEWSPDAFRFLGLRHLDNVARATICRIPFPDETFDLVISLDVLYCVASPGDVQALREMFRVLKKGGALLLNLPAYEFLRSHHDAAIHTQRRYTRGRLRDMLKQVGFQVQAITYRNSLLFPIAVVVRCTQKLFRPAPAKPRSDLHPLPNLLNRALTLPLFLENRLIRSGVSFPFGLSVFGVVTRAG